VYPFEAVSHGQLAARGVAICQETTWPYWISFVSKWTLYKAWWLRMQRSKRLKHSAKSTWSIGATVSPEASDLEVFFTFDTLFVFPYFGFRSLPWKYRLWCLYPSAILSLFMLYSFYFTSIPLFLRRSQLGGPKWLKLQLSGTLVQVPMCKYSCASVPVQISTDFVHFWAGSSSTPDEWLVQIWTRFVDICTK
jgi:hypothetical protein